MHKQKIADLGWLRIDVDEELVIILEVLNKAGFSTCNSCQDNNGKVWIQFDSPDTAKKLHKKSLKYYNSQNSEETQQDFSCLWDFLQKNWIEWKLEYYDDLDQIGEIEMLASLRFPREHLGLFQDLLQKEPWLRAYQLT